MRLQTKGTPDAADGCLRHPGFAGHRARTPVRSALGLGLQGLGDHGVHPCIVNGARRPWPGSIQQAVEPMLDKACSPLGHRLLGHALARGHRIVGFPCATGQHNARSQCKCLRSFAPQRQRNELLSLDLAQYQLRLRSSSHVCLRRVHTLHDRPQS